MRGREMSVKCGNELSANTTDITAVCQQLGGCGSRGSPAQPGAARQLGSLQCPMSVGAMFLVVVVLAMGLGVVHPAGVQLVGSPEAQLRVVVLLFSPVRAHRDWVRPLIDELRRAGHDVNVGMVLPSEERDPARRRRVDMLQERLTWTYRNLSGFQRLRDERALGRELSESLLRSKRLAAALKEWRPADVLVTDYWMTDAALAFAWEWLGRPACVVLSPQSSTPPWVHRLVGNPPRLEAASLLGRVAQLAQLLFEDFKYHWQHLPAEREHCAACPEPPVALVLANELSGLSMDRPGSLRVQKVGGMRRSWGYSQSADLYRASMGNEFSRNLWRHLHPNHGAITEGSIVVEVDRRAGRILKAVVDNVRSFDPSVVVFTDKGMRMDDTLWLPPYDNSVIWVNDPTCRSECWLDVEPRPRLVVWVGHVPLAHAAALHGIPQVAVPLSADEAALADRLASAGVALVVDATDIDKGRKLKHAISKAATCPRLRTAAADLARSLSLEPVQDLALARARRAVEVAPHVARLLAAGAPRGHHLLAALQVDALLGLAAASALALAAGAALCALLATLLCYRKKYASKPKRD